MKNSNALKGIYRRIEVLDADEPESFKASHNIHSVVTEICDYIVNFIESQEAPFWPEGMLSKASTILVLCDVAYAHWRARRFDDCLLVAEQARMLLEEMTAKDEAPA